MINRIVQINKKWSDHFSTKKFFFCTEMESYTDTLKMLIEKSLNSANSILEVGGIDRPLWYKNKDLIYDGLDIEYKDKCEEIYDHFIVQSIEEPVNGKYDLIISRTLLEHVPDNKKAFNSIYQALSEHGETIHYLPSKYHIYSLILRLVGNKGQRFLIKKLRPWAADVTGYPTFFNYCSPRQMRKLLAETGFKSIKITCFYHANDYFSFCFPLFLLVTLWENLCKKINLETFCAGFVVEAHK